MGRKKLKLELIPKDKSRMVTFKKRKEGLVRKLHELAILCDVKACMILYGPKQENSVAQPEICLENCDNVHEMIDIYKAKKEENKSFGLNEYFVERKREVEDELSKFRKKNLEAKYPTDFAGLNSMTEGELRQFAAFLSNKSEYVKSKIEILKRSSNNQRVMNVNNLMHLDQFYPPPSAPSLPMHTIGHYQELQPFDQNCLMMLLMNGDQHGNGMVGSWPLPHYDGFDWMEYGDQYGGGGGVVDLNDLDLSFVASEHCVPETMPNSSYGDLDFFIDGADYFPL